VTPQKTSYHLDVPSHYLHHNAGEGKPLLLFLHGYADSAASFLRRTLPEGDSRFETLAPNGPFPLPQRKENEWKEAYGWYFADFSSDRIVIHPKVAAQAVANLVEQLGLRDRPKILVGFSQGGYFLPHLARELHAVKRFIGIGAGYQARFFAEYGLTQQVDAIHGSADEVISLAESRTDFNRLAPESRGTYREVLEMTHKINEAGRAALMDCLSS
jgi:predicted esterase